MLIKNKRKWWLESSTERMERSFFAASFAGDLSALKYAVNLKKLSISCDPDFKDISVLAKLTNLEELSINQGGGINDLSALANMKSLQKLELYVEHISDISPLANLTELSETKS